MKSAEQQFYDMCFSTSNKLGYKTYPSKPLEDVPYPFVEMGETLEIFNVTKSKILGKVSITIHVWGSGEDRYLISTMCNNLLHEMQRVRETGSFFWKTNINECHTQIIQDISTGTALWHGIIDVTSKYY